MSDFVYKNTLTTSKVNAILFDRFKIVVNTKYKQIASDNKRKKPTLYLILNEVITCVSYNVACVCVCVC